MAFKYTFQKRSFLKASFLVSSLRYLIVLLLPCLFYLYTPTEEYYNPICIILILLFGVPHGAADHHIHQSFATHKTTKYKFILKYVSLALVYAMWWYAMPGKALMAFILLSAYHFSQEFLEHLQLKRVTATAVIIWGVIIMIMPLLLTYGELKTSIHKFTPFELPPISWQLRTLLVTVILVTGALHTLIEYKKSHLSNAQVFSMICMVAILLTLFSFLPFLVAFTVYFIFFHSSHAFSDQYHWLKLRNNKYTIKRFIHDLVPLSVLSILGLLLIVYVLDPAHWTDFLAYFFIIISVITLPHAILFDDFYKFRRTKPNI